MKNSKKILKIILIFLMLISIGLVISNNILAWDVDGELSAIESAVNEKKSGNAGTTVRNIMGALVNIVSTVGAGIAIIMLVVIGIQYVSKGAEGKANAKEDLIGYVIGAVILFGVSGLLKLIQMFVDKNLNEI